MHLSQSNVRAKQTAKESENKKEMQTISILADKNNGVVARTASFQCYTMQPVINTFNHLRP
jgi:hypothetical protein